MMIISAGAYTTLNLVVNVNYAGADLQHVGANAVGDILGPSREQELCQLWYFISNVVNPSGLYGT